jgi:glycogen debranching enzyme
MAGLPDFPWWFGCDTAYGVLPLLPSGQTAAAVASLRTLAAFGKRCDPHGAVPHEVLPYGQVWASGNLVELPLFVRALYHTYCWTGDRGLLRELFPFCLQALRAWPLADCERRASLVPHGKSIVETPEMASDDVQALDVAAYLAEALDCLATLATELDDPELATDLRQRAAQTRAHVRDAWWLPQASLFGDLYASPRHLRRHQAALEARAMAASRASEEAEAQALREAAAALEQALEERTSFSSSGPSESNPKSEEAPRPWLLYHMVQALALDAGLPSLAQAEALLSHLEGPEWQESCGLVLNARRNRAVMTLPTGALAVGAARYGRPDQALAWMQRMSTAFGLASPGTLSEYAPDKGCFLQLWSSYGIVWPVVHYFFGLRPQVATRRLLCIPQPPRAWPRATLRRVPLASASLDVELTVEPDSLQVQLTISEPDWELLPGLALPPDQRIREARLNGRPVTLQPAQFTGFEERTIWLAPALQQTTAYELLVRWSPSGAAAGL